MYIALILAAGEGKRMKSDLPKVLHEVNFKPLVNWVLDATSDAEKQIVIIGHMADKVKKSLGDSVNYAMQEKQLGTGHAVMQAKEYLEGASGSVVVISGDTPLITKETLDAAFAYHNTSNNAVTVLTAHVANPAGYGRIVRNFSGNVTKIVEHKDANSDELIITEINSGIYFFDIASLLSTLDKITSNNAQGEYYLTDTIEILISENKKVGAFIVGDNNEILGINDRIQLAQASEIMRKRITTMHMQNGVTFISPETAYIGGSVIIGRDTIIMPNTVLEGKTEIANDCIIGPNSRIVDSKIDNGVEINNSVILQSEIGSDTHVGPFAYVRPNCKIGKNIKIGDFVEVKNSVIDDGTKVSHLTYIGDADVGKNVNFGCGTIIVNYDGEKKYRTTVDDGAFVGCNSNLISPVKINKGAFVAAGSTITDDIPANGFAIARSRQVVKTDWKKK